MKRARKGQEKILTLIEDDPKISVAVLAKESGLTVKMVRNIIDELKSDNLLERIGPDKGGYWKVLH